ncbi:MAG TPA: hypothetical protein VF595_11680 [Tepidisphaeraceae bacterium]|jgi:hypothetical protein
MATKQTKMKAAVGVALLGAAGAMFYSQRPEAEEPYVPPPPPVVPGRLTAAEATAKADAEDSATERAMRSPGRYVRVPLPEGASIEQDAGGGVWFETFFGDDDVLRRSVERAARGQTRVIRGGRVLLVDSHGCYWVRSNTKTNVLLRYDGKTWLTPYSVERTPVKAAPGQTVRNGGPAAFFRTALETDGGDRFFVSGSSQVPAALHRCATDGTWTQTPLPNNVMLQTEALLAEQVDGRVAVYTEGDSPQGNGMSLEKSRLIGAFKRQMGFAGRGKVAAYVWSDKAFVAVEPAAKAGMDSPLSQAVPLPDGSIMTVYEGSDRVTPAWPSEGIAERDERVARLVKDLSAPDARAREAAMTNLLKLGPPARAAVETALKDPANGAPQRQEMLEAVAEQLRAGADPGQAPEESLFGGRYRLSGVVQTSRTPGGAVRLFVNRASDVQTQTDYGPSFVTIDRRGQWRVDPVPDKPELAPLAEAAQRAFEDTRGRLWVDGWLGGEDKRVIDPADFSVRPALPVGVNVTKAQASDRDGRVYFSARAGHCVVFNPNAADTPPDLPVTQDQTGILLHRPGEAAAFVEEATPSVINADGTVTAIAPPFGRRCVAVSPLRGGTADVFSRRVDNPDGLYRNLWDGRTYRFAVAGFFKDRVANESDVLMRVAASTFADARPGQPNQQVVSDRGEGLWYLSQESSTERRLVNVNDVTLDLNYFNGSEWFDVWPLFEGDSADVSGQGVFGTANKDLGVPGVVDNGHTLLVYSRPKAEVWAVVFEEGKLRRTRVATDVQQAPADQITSVNGRSWFSTDPWDTKAGSLFAYRDGKFAPMPWPGKPRLADSADRLWCVKGLALVVVDGDRTGNLDVPDLDSETRVAQSPDGRLWLLRASGLDELSVVDGRPKLGRHWNWNAPMNAFDGFIDTRNGLWLGGNGGRVGRFQLPPAAGG